ncbi:MAG TPA: sulfite oxidase [Candidatus Eisenbacteria bacterium]|nr:sulfite oxidase [Candidatus Eisenbacteria bacterium]
MTRLGRRAFLERLARLGVGAAAVAALPRWARAAVVPEGSLPFIIRSDRPEQLETTLSDLGQSWITRNDRFFVRSHLSVPRLEAGTWRLEVTGRVRTPLSLSLGDFDALPMVEAVHTLECAGNGRALFHLPSTSGIQWDWGAVGNAKWSGVRLSTVLQRAGVAPEAKHVWFEAADQAPLPDAPRFVRSVPIEKAMEDVLLAHTMNDQRLPELHGAPLRAIVPGWFGMASTKWLTGLRLEEKPSDNHFMARGYRYNYPGEDPATAPPVEHLLVKSLITHPIDGSEVTVAPRPGAKPGTKPKLRVQGFAWAGPAGVRLVEVSSDGGTTWRPAGFMGDNAAMAWRAWATEFDVTPPARLVILARATDNDGVTQPLGARTNGGGYGNNSIHRVKVRVRT